MPGTKAGALKAQKTLRKKYGKKGLKKWREEIGKKGGSISRGGGFANNPELARIAGAKGGRISKRGKAK